MARLPILIAPDPRLKQKAKPVEAIDDELRRLLDDMLETMYAAPGIGLAAPQVGVPRRAVVVDLAREGEERHPLRLINPEIVWASEEEAESSEGCLSIPDFFGEVARPEKVRVRYIDEHAETREIEAEGLLATCLQHEIDHLDGILFIDHLSALKRSIILRKLQKAKRAQEEA